MTLPALFRHRLFINGVEYTSFFDVSIVNKCSGNGTSGTVSMQLNFKIKSEDYFFTEIPKKAVVKFFVDGSLISLPDFFINRRSKSGKFISFSCLDRIALTDKPINLENLSFDENDTVSYIMLIQCICSTCGFSDWGYYGGAVFGSLPNIKKSDIYGKSCRAILDEFSKACCGIWFTNAENKLLFVPYGSVICEEVNVINHAEIDTGLTSQKYDGVIMINGDKTFISGYVSEEGNVLTINTLYASQDLANAVMNAIKDVEYQQWSCSRAEIDSSIFVNSSIRFDENSLLFCNDLTLYPRAYGIYATLSCNAVEEDEISYNGEITKALNNCIKGDADYNGCMVTRYQGLVFTAEEPSKAKATGDTVKKQYGFATSSGGITEYDGAMVSKVVPKSATWNADKTEAVIDYGGKKFRYKINRDEAGNVTNFEKEEVVE